MNQPLTFPILLAVPLVALSVALAGCEASLGDCDPGMDVRVAFQEGGMPAYEGQALMETSCASTFCHTSGAVGEFRKGAPAGLDFDVSVACGPDDDCASEAGVLAVQRLRADQRRVVSWAGRILRTVERGHMPPGAEGREVVEGNVRALGYHDGIDPLPSITSAEGTEILRNWLACGAPVVERAVSPFDDRVPGQRCNDVYSTLVGDCMVGETCDLTPTWASIFECVIRPKCVACHSEEQPVFLEASALDLSTAQVGYDALVDMPGAGAECDGEGTLVVPGDADASLLIHKLEVRHDATIEVCGDGMPTPPLAPVPQAQIDVIRAWIDAGAAGP
jgi:hypothetical protein